MRKTCRVKLKEARLGRIGLSKREFKANLSYLAPIAFALVATYFFTLLVIMAQVEVVSITLFPEEAGGPLMNATIFIATMVVAGVAIYIVIRHRLWPVLSLIFRCAVALVVLTLAIFYQQLLFIVLEKDLNEVALLIYATSVVFAATAIYGIFKWRGIKQVTVTLLLGGALGAFLGASIPTTSSLVLLTVLSLYDIVAVYWGPVGKIASEAEPERLKGISFTFRDVHMGLGDLVFYSMLASRMLLVYGFKVWFASSMGILTGVYLGLKVLEKRRMFPGLPIALAFGLIASFAASLVL